MIDELKKKIISDITEENKNIIDNIVKNLVEEIIEKNISPVLGFIEDNNDSVETQFLKKREYIKSFFEKTFNFPNKEKIIFNIDKPTVFTLKNHYFNIIIDADYIKYKDKDRLSYIIENKKNHKYSFKIEFDNRNYKTNQTRISIKDFHNDSLLHTIFENNSIVGNYGDFYDSDVIDYIIKNIDLNNKELFEILALKNDIAENNNEVILILYENLLCLKNEFLTKKETIKNTI